MHCSCTVRDCTGPGLLPHASTSAQTRIRTGSRVAETKIVLKSEQLKPTDEIPKPNDSRIKRHCSASNYDAMVVDSMSEDGNHTKKETTQV